MNTTHANTVILARTTNQVALERRQHEEVVGMSFFIIVSLIIYCICVGAKNARKAQVTTDLDGPR